jgi:hypothetical protein
LSGGKKILILPFTHIQPAWVSREPPMAGSCRGKELRSPR